MNVFGSSLAGETNKVIANLETDINITKNELSVVNQILNVHMESIKALEEIVKSMNNIYTKLEDTVELKNKINGIEKRIDYTENYLGEVVTLLRARDSEYFKISTEVTAKEEGRV